MLDRMFDLKKNKKQKTILTIAKQGLSLPTALQCVVAIGY
jgi:hypothetical protein